MSLNHSFFVGFHLCTLDKISSDTTFINILLSSIPEKAMAPHSSTLAWRIPWMEEPGGLQPRGRWGSDTIERLHFHFSLSCIGEGNGNPLHCSCLENPRNGRAWWAAVYGVAQSWTRLKWLSSSVSSHRLRVQFYKTATHIRCQLKA